MRADLLHLARNMRRSPASAVAAILTLSLTLGTAAAIFAVVDAVVITPPPFSNPNALVSIGEVPLDDPSAAPRAVAYATFEAWRERAGSLASLEAFDGTNFTLTELGAAERVSATYTTPGFLALLGVTPARGRTFDVDDVGQRVAIVSHSFWHGKLAADPGVIGRRIVLGGQAHTIIGVLQERFVFALGPSELWLPFPVTPVQAARAGYRVRVVARLPGNVTPSGAASALDEVSRMSSPPARAAATPIAVAIAGDAPRTLGLLAAAAALAILIAFTNLAGLLIVRSIDRRRELAVRTALGASRWEIARQLLLEAHALVVLGIAGGILLAMWITPVVGRLALEQFQALAIDGVDVSWRAIGVVAVCAIICGSICGLLPAVASARRRVVDALRVGATAPPRELALRRVFVAGEVALACVLLVAMSLVGRSLLRLLTVNPGFDAAGVLTLQLSLPAASYSSRDHVVSFYSSLQNALAARLGPRSIAIVDELPLTGSRGRSVVSAQPAAPGPEAIVREASPVYFDVLRIPLVAGRTFEAGDDASASPRIVVSERLAEKLFPVAPAVGRRIWLAPASQPAEVIGVVGDVKQRALDEAPSLTAYLSAWQSSSRNRIVVIRSARSDADVIAIVREEVARLDRSLPVYGRRRMPDIVAASPGLPARRVLAATFTGFAGLAVMLSAIGLFGIAAHDVARRRAELALRIALGADAGQIFRSTLAPGALTIGSGLAIGGLLSIGTARALDAALIGGERLDFISVLVTAAVLVLTGVIAILPAARRAARTDPLAALRSE